MKSILIICLLGMIQFALAGGIDRYEGDDDITEIVIRAIAGNWKFPSHIKATHALFVGGRDFYSSAIYGIDSYGNFEKSLGAQIKQVIINLLYLLEAAKLKIKNVVFVTVTIDIEYYKAFFEVYEEYFPKKQYPAIFIFEGKLPKGAYLHISVVAISGNIKYIKKEYDGDNDEY